MNKSLIIFGIVNITSDSFSDGGRYLAPDAAIAQARKLMAEGADVIDLGPASSNPDAAPVSSDTEIARIAPVLDALKADGIPVSLDSYQPATQAYALSRGVAYLNDIRGFPDAAFYPQLAKSSAKLVVMHSVQDGQADRREAPAGDIMDHIAAFFDARIAALTGAGIKRNRLVLDPGMGFFLGAAPETSLSVLARFDELRLRFDLPVLLSVSRKSFLRALTGRGPGDVGAATLAAELAAAAGGADFIRTHEPRPLLSEKVVIYYEKRGNAENYIKEAKYDMAVGHLLLKSFWANEAVFQMMMLSYNLFLLFKFDSLDSSEYRQQIKTFRLKYVFLAAKIIKTARYVIMKLSENYPYKGVYEKCLV